jgi:hypothetical protein
MEMWVKARKLSPATLWVLPLGMTSSRSEYSGPQDNEIFHVLIQLGVVWETGIRINRDILLDLDGRYDVTLLASLGTIK